MCCTYTIGLEVSVRCLPEFVTLSRLRVSWTGLLLPVEIMWGHCHTNLVVDQILGSLLPSHSVLSHSCDGLALGLLAWPFIMFLMVKFLFFVIFGLFQLHVMRELNRRFFHSISHCDVWLIFCKIFKCPVYPPDFLSIWIW